MDAMEYLKKQIEDGYIASDGEPLKCPSCGGNNLEEKTVDSIGYTVAEKICYCGDCWQNLGYWAHGYWV